MDLGTTTTTNQILLSTLSVLENMANDISLLIVFGTILILFISCFTLLLFTLLYYFLPKSKKSYKSYNKRY